MENIPTLGELICYFIFGNIIFWTVIAAAWDISQDKTDASDNGDS